ncbi:hypothetical protein L2734_17770 [Parashewanella spongiae]|nr:hypothetical protein [Parashewanella spongiae]MCL1079983.1 hypothetical protein [Parashewanella spongiae]
MAVKHKVHQDFICVDAFNVSDVAFNSKQHAFALHACGDFHQKSHQEIC